MILFATALPFEAKPIIRALALKQIASPANGRLYANKTQSVGLLQTGMGNKKTTATCESFFRLKTRTLFNSSILINIGIAGSTNPNHSLGDVFGIHCVTNQFDESTYHLETLFPDLASAELLTVENPCSNIAELNLLESQNPLLDMEAYPLVKVFTQNGFPLSRIHSIKIVSDFANKTEIDTKKLAAAYDKTVISLINQLKLNQA